jgi:hypothetical protein
MKKILLLSFLFLFSLMAVNSYAQNIIIVTDNEAGSQVFADDLIAEGYTVVIKTDLAVEPSADQITELNEADLIIFARSTNSANYNFPDVWNNIETPILMSSCFMTRSSRLNWVSSAATNEADGMEITISDDTHPIFQGIDVSTGTLAITATTPLHTNPVADAGNGTVLAVSSTTGNVVIAEWPKDTEFYEASGSFATEYRAVFFTGLAYDFTETGKALYLNMVKYILNPDAVVSVKNVKRNEIKIYPLPVDNTLRIGGNFLPNTNFEIVSLSGQVLISSVLPIDNQINTSDLKQGVYVLKMKAKDQVLTRKFVKR